MSSGRALRKSPRTASPLPGFTHSRTPDSVDFRQPQESRSAPATSGKLAPWADSPLREPLPSFQDHPGSDRGVLEFAPPLGQFPAQRVKLRVKQYEPPKRYVQTKLMQGSLGDGAAKRGQGRRRQSESRPIEPATVTPKREIPNSTDSIKSEAGTYLLSGETNAIVMAKTPFHSSPTAAPTTQIPHLPFSHPTVFTTSTYSGNAPYESLRETIDAAVARSIEKKQRTRGLAIKKLYEEGFTDPNLAALLDAILSQKANEDQRIQFQTYIKGARKEFKAEKSHSRRSSTTIGANAIVESIENSPVSRLLATPATRPQSSHHTSFNHLAQPLFSQPPSLDHHNPSLHDTFNHHNNFPDEDTPLASLEGGAPLSPSLLESTTDIMPPKKRPAETNGEGPSKKTKVAHDSDVPNAPVSKAKATARKPRAASAKPKAAASKSTASKPTTSKSVDSKPTDTETADTKLADTKLTNTEPDDTKPTNSNATDNKPTNITPTDSNSIDEKSAEAKSTGSKSAGSKSTARKRSASKDDDPAAQEPSSKRVKRGSSATSTSSALTEMDSDGLKDLEEVATKEKTPKFLVDGPFAKSSNLLPCTQKNAESFLAPPERRASTPTYVATNETAEVDAKTGGRPTRTRQPSRRAIEAGEQHRQNLPVFTRDDLPAQEVDKLIKSFRREHEYKVEESHIRHPTVDHSSKPSPALAGTPTLDLPNIAEQDEDADSPLSASSSDAGELLVPPPPGAQRTSKRTSRINTPRGASPTKTTRATRNGLRVARVKQS